jgi:hypothetical protein
VIRSGSQTQEQTVPLWPAPGVMVLGAILEDAFNYLAVLCFQYGELSVSVVKTIYEAPAKHFC